MAEDELWAVKNAFFLGCYQQAISEAMSASVSDASRVLCNFYMYRAYVEQAQYRMVLDEVGHDAPMALQAVKLLASYLQSAGRDGKEMAMVQLKEWLSATVWMFVLYTVLCTRPRTCTRTVLVPYGTYVLIRVLNCV